MRGTRALPSTFGTNMPILRHASVQHTLRAYVLVLHAQHAHDTTLSVPIAPICLPCLSFSIPCYAFGACCLCLAMATPITWSYHVLAPKPHAIMPQSIPSTHAHVGFSMEQNGTGLVFGRRRCWLSSLQFTNEIDEQHGGGGVVREQLITLTSNSFLREDYRDPCEIKNKQAIFA